MRVPQFLVAIQVVLILSSPVHAASKSRILSPTLRQLTQKSGFIFGGTVLSVHRIPSGTRAEMPTVLITFRVDQAIRGVKVKQTFALREWAGLWESGDRYRVGEHVLLFLYPFSRLGLSSPVSGSFGRFALDNQGRLMLRHEQLAVFAPGPQNLKGKKTLVDKREFVRAIQREAAR